SPTSSAGSRKCSPAEADSCPIPPAAEGRYRNGGTVRSVQTRRPPPPPDPRGKPALTSSRTPPARVLPLPPYGPPASAGLHSDRPAGAPPLPSQCCFSSIVVANANGIGNFVHKDFPIADLARARGGDEGPDHFIGARG